MLLKLLFVLFVGLKLGNVIDWSWWLVWIPMFIVMARGAFNIIFLDAIKRSEPWAIKLAIWLRE